MNTVDPPTAAPDSSSPSGVTFQFLRGNSNALERERTEDHEQAVSFVRNSVTEVLNAPNIAFLLGAGCSSQMSAAAPPTEVGIPTMSIMADFFSAIPPAPYALSAEENDHLRIESIDISKDAYRKNIERFMEVLHAHRFVLTQTDSKDELTLVDGLIKKIELFIVDKCLRGPFATGDNTVLESYRRFFRKLVYRDRSLPRPWIFSSNYDLFSERALDGLGISYCNGFSGVVDRMFNPVTFKYALAEQLDVSSRKWSVVDNHLYLCKLHGSVNWVQDDAAGIYGIREIQIPRVTEDTRTTMVFPTPLKHHATLASPYTDLFREFQSRIVREQTVLVTIGYSFGDTHIDNIIHQALTVPTFRLVVFGSPAHPGIKRLVDLDDPRIWVISGNSPGGEAVHYFRFATDNFLPELPSDRIDTSVSKVVDLIRTLAGPEAAVTK